MTRASMLLAVMLVGCTNSGPGGSTSSSSSTGGTVADAASMELPDAAPPNPRQCGTEFCAINEVCIRTPDSNMCAPRCSLDGGCGAGQVCRPALGDAGSNVCIAAGGVGDTCAPEPCLDGLVCVHVEDAGARCRYACDTDDDAGIACPENWICFPFPDASAGACEPR